MRHLRATAWFGLVFLLLPVLSAAEQTTCPVMEGNAINKELFTDYKGKRVYFCCEFCLGKFKDDPSPFLSNLPQFASPEKPEGGSPSTPDAASAPGAAAPTVSAPATRLSRFIMPAGITGASLLFLTAILGLSIKKARNRILPWHKRVAILTVLAVITHVTLVLTVL